MLKLKEDYYKDIEDYLQQYLYDTFYMPLLAILDENKLTPKKQLVNSINSLLSALNKGTITYNDREFKGSFNIAVSKELSKFAIFDKRSKSWKVKNVAALPASVNATIVETKSRIQKLNEDLELLFSNLEDRFNSDIEPLLNTPIESTIDKMQEQLGEDFLDIRVSPTLTEDQKIAFAKDYNLNQTLNIKNWNTEQVIRLRDMVTRLNMTGFNKISLTELIQREWDVTRNKAKFLARQETSLFLSKFRKEQSKKAGINRYKWSTSHDEKVRPKNGNKHTKGNNHKMLDGKVFFYGDPPIIDTKTGRRAEPGEDFNCRCVAIPVIREAA